MTIPPTEAEVTTTTAMVEQITTEAEVITEVVTEVVTEPPSGNLTAVPITGKFSF